ncbi:hypothetical protein L1277_001344 [Okibacterium sp. HSC-33S16]|uniref:hypothetical protein n=1 Tax=Okibacterium sp. HSC-33S16 TaxID=2910965 RepID=UPI0020A0C9F1|nr:hypothetical protein [Okibacterium sp. HSC-33S16]MCP2031253.1 hypothetical protein [Okibacterium sp. HSC-33S16]
MPETELRGASLVSGQRATERRSQPLFVLYGRAISQGTASLRSQCNDIRILLVAASTCALKSTVVPFLVPQKQVARSIAISGFK